MPPYNYIELDQKDFGGCLLYVESISVQVFQNSDKKKAKPLSATAVLRGGKDQKNKFAFDKSFVSCYSKDAKKEEFSYVFFVSCMFNRINIFILVSELNSILMKKLKQDLQIQRLCISLLTIVLISRNFLHL